MASESKRIGAIVVHSDLTATATGVRVSVYEDMRRASGLSSYIVQPVFVQAFTLESEADVAQAIDGVRALAQSADDRAKRKEAEDAAEAAREALAAAERAKHIDLPRTRITMEPNKFPWVIRHKGGVALVFYFSASKLTPGHTPSVDEATAGLLASERAMARWFVRSAGAPVVQSVQDATVRMDGDGHGFVSWNVPGAGNDLYERTITEAAERFSAPLAWTEKEGGGYESGAVAVSPSVMGDGSDVMMDAPTGRAPIGTSLLAVLSRFVRGTKHPEGESVKTLTFRGARYLAVASRAMIREEFCPKSYREVFAKAKPEPLSEAHEAQANETFGAIYLEGSPACVVGAYYFDNAGTGGGYESRVIVRSEEDGADVFYHFDGDTFAWLVCAGGGATSLRTRRGDTYVYVSLWRGDVPVAFAGHVPNAGEIPPELARGGSCSVTDMVSPLGLEAIKKATAEYSALGASLSAKLARFDGAFATGSSLSFTMKRSDLKEALAARKGAVPKRANPVDRAVCIAAESGAVAVTITERSADGRTRFGFRLIYPAHVQQAGSAVVPFDAVWEFLSDVASGAGVTVSGDAADGFVRLASQGEVDVRARVAPPRYGEILPPYAAEMKEAATLDPVRLFALAKAMDGVRSQDDTRPHIARWNFVAGATVAGFPNDLCMEATDGHMGAVASLGSPFLSPRGSQFGVPDGVGGVFLRFAEEAKASGVDVAVSVGSEERQYGTTFYAMTLFRADNGSFLWCLEGDAQPFPSVDRLITREKRATAMVDRKSLWEAASAAAKENDRASVTMTFAPGSFPSFTAQPVVGPEGARAARPLRVASFERGWMEDGQSLRANVRASYLAALLEVSESPQPEVSVQVQEPTGNAPKDYTLDPVVLRSPRAVAIVMPMRE